jgi:haloacetate dehalogenase
VTRHAAGAPAGAGPTGDAGPALHRLAQQLGEALGARGLRLVTAESCTAGGVAYAVTQVAGSSAWFDRGFITYSDQAKRDLLGVPAALLRDHGAVSEPVARAMALGALAAGRAQVAVAITGIAGPGGGSPRKPVGTVCFAWAIGTDAGATARTQTCRFDGDRAAVRTQAIVTALEGLIATVATQEDRGAGRAPARPSHPADALFDAALRCERLPVNGITVNVRRQATDTGRPPLLLLHGFPQTHAIWHRVAPRLAQRFTLVLPDLRGYGDSDRPAGPPDHSAYSKRAMARDAVELMRALGYERFFVCGHDRGARVAHRLALDHPRAVARLMLLDIAPTLTMYERTTMEFARLYYHWFFLIQPAPLPERLIACDPAGYLRAKLGGWGTHGLAIFDPRALAEYERCFAAPAAVHAMCEDYRAAATIDLAHDRADREARIGCDLRVLWGERGVVHRLFDPLADWRARCSARVDGRALPCGHYVAEEVPDLLCEQIEAFFC